MSSEAQNTTTSIGLYVSAEHATVMKEVFDAIEQRNWGVFDSHPGLYETREHLPVLVQSFPDLTQTLEKEFSQGDQYTYIASVSGTHLGDYFGIPATGKHVTFQLIGIEQIVDGKIIQHNAIPDAFSLFMQLGVSFTAPQESASM